MRRPFKREDALRRPPPQEDGQDDCYIIGHRLTEDHALHAKQRLQEIQKRDQQKSLSQNRENSISVSYHFVSTEAHDISP